MVQKHKNQKKRKTTKKDFSQEGIFLIKCTAIEFFILLLAVLVPKNAWKIPENWDLTLIIQSVLVAIAFISFFACICSFIHALKRKIRNDVSSLDEACLQEYVRGVGTYLGADSDQELSLYRSVAAEIYRHIPQKYWELVDKIDDDILMDDRDAAWKDLKLFIKFIVKNEGE